MNVSRDIESAINQPNQEQTKNEGLSTMLQMLQLKNRAYQQHSTVATIHSKQKHRPPNFFCCKHPTLSFPEQEITAVRTVYSPPCSFVHSRIGNEKLFSTP